MEINEGAILLHNKMSLVMMRRLPLVGMSTMTLEGAAAACSSAATSRGAAAELCEPSTSGRAFSAWISPSAQHPGPHRPGSAVHGEIACGLHGAWSALGSQLQQLRGYKSNKKSLKPMNTAASWKAVEPFLPPAARRLPMPAQPQQAIIDTAIPEMPEVPKPEPFVRVGVLEGQYSLELQKLFAVVEIAGTQFKVTADDVLFVNQLHGTEVNDVLELRRVMMLGSTGQTVIGRPYVPDACVRVAVEEHFRDGKVHVFKRNPRKRYRKYMTTRPHLTTLRVLEVRGLEPGPGELVAQVPLPIRWLPNGSGSSEEEEGEEATAAAVGSSSRR
jgi:ribosomal protein L21